MDPYSLFSSPLATIGVFAFATVAGLVARSWRKRRSPTLKGTSVLLSYYTEGSDVILVNQGLIGDMYYSVMVTSARKDSIASSLVGVTLYRVELPFVTKIHLLGVPKKSGAAQLNPAFGSKGIMERVDLEGDYNNYFSLFVEKNSQVEARYVLDPKAMVFTIDFCQSHNWEIVGNDLYFLQENDTSAHDDPTFMFQDIERFVQEIEPALQDLNVKRNPHEMSYNRDTRRDLVCPIGSEKLINKDDYFACPVHHGILMIGGKLAMLRDGKLKISSPDNAEHRTQDAARKLSCPSCNSAMNQVPYNGSHVIIDTCSKCAYRWLDNGEAQKIANNRHGLLNTES